MTSKQRTLNAAIRGLFNSTLLFLPAYCIVWLLLGHPPVWWQIFLASEALELSIRALLNHLRRREVRAVRNQFDEIVYGDQRPGDPTT